MKLRITIALLFLFSFGNLLSEQNVFDLKQKTKANEKERTYLLDSLRSKMLKEFNQEFIYIVDHFKLSGDYVWFKGQAKRKDGKEISLPEDEPYDCCHVEVLFSKIKGKWEIAEYSAFSTDVWYEGIEAKYPKANKLIFKIETIK